MKLPPDFRDLLVEFARERVEHVILGGYAFAYHAEPRATKDLDLLIEGSAENRIRAARALERLVDRRTSSTWSAFSEPGPHPVDDPQSSGDVGVLIRAEARHLEEEVVALRNARRLPGCRLVVA